MSKKQRLDALLVARKFVSTRSKAADLVKRGAVCVEGVKFCKPGKLVAVDARLEVDNLAQPFVSRGGLKLAAALDYFNIDVGGKIALDVGASTGGFTDVLLRRGGDHVFAVDSGHGQLHRDLLDNPRVSNLERLNIRELDKSHIGAPIDIIVCDVSFISLKKALPRALTLARTGAWLVALIKPQFEVGRGGVGKGGIVRGEAQRQQICGDIHSWLSREMGWQVAGLVPSPVQGADGNIEFLIAATNKLV